MNRNPAPPHQPGQPKPERIDVRDEGALRDWAHRLDTTPEQLRDAVAEVGDRAADVELHLKGSRASTNADEEAKAEGRPPG
jgi:hypothetical protein